MISYKFFFGLKGGIIGLWFGMMMSLFILSNTTKFYVLEQD